MILAQPSCSKHKFSVVRSAGQSGYNYVNPPQRDVVALGTTGDNVTIRWVTDNPGPWYLHWYNFLQLVIYQWSLICLLTSHIDWHLDAGLAIVFAEDVPDVAAYNPVSGKAVRNVNCPYADRRTIFL